MPTTNRDRRPAAIFFGAACLSLAAEAGPVAGGTDVPETRSTRVPFESIDNAMAAEVRLNGSHRLRFLVDTGASATVLDVRKPYDARDADHALLPVSRRRDILIWTPEVRSVSLETLTKP